MSHRPFHLIAVMRAAVSVLMVAHTAEVVVWVSAYEVVGVGFPGTDLFYFAFVNYPTLGYGDVTFARANDGDERRVLLFGWSTAVIFAVLRKAMTPGSTEDGQREKGVSVGVND
jgi:hypothetical protein